MATKNDSATPTFIRFLAIGVLLSMAFTYSVHVMGEWKIENYRPDSQTTSTVLLHNKCAVFGVLHTLRPNTDMSTLGDGIDGTKLGGSFMNFIDGHVVVMIILSLVFGVGILLIRNAVKKNSVETQLS